MGIIVNLKNRPNESQTHLLLSSNPSNLVEELDRYRRKTERLARIYDLHKRLSEKLDLTSMIDAFSIWLYPFLNHELMAYRHGPKNRGHTVCSSHGPRRQILMETAQTLLGGGSGIDAVGCDLPPGGDLAAGGALQAGGHSDSGSGWGEWDADGGCCQSGDLPHLGLRYLLLALDGDPAGEALLLLHGEPAETDPGLECFMVEILEELRGPLERALTYEELYDQARRDALTGLVNRRVFQERLSQELTQAQRYDTPLALAGLDLDHFKSINDRLGHAEGDEVLRRVSRTLMGRVRDSDLLARVGGDEFQLILPNTDLESGAGLMHRLCEAVADLGIQAPGCNRLGVSIGIAAWERGESMEQWMQRVDEALYRAKAAGRSQVSL